MTQSKAQPLSRIRLDRFIKQSLACRERDVRIYLAQKRIIVDGAIVCDGDFIIDKFSKVAFDNQCLQDNPAYYIMLHKPVGVVSATKDLQHQTVIDLLDLADKDSLHIVGRLDLNTSGLVLLTNDSRWSQRLTLPESHVEKCYHVILEEPLTAEYIDAFAQGMHFEFEDITTKPAQLTILSEFTAEVVLTEGRYHQIKRMFGRFQNKVIGLHRSAIGGLTLDELLPVGESRSLTQQEVNDIFNCSSLHK